MKSIRIDWFIDNLIEIFVMIDFFSKGSRFKIFLYREKKNRFLSCDWVIYKFFKFVYDEDVCMLLIFDVEILVIYIVSENFVGKYVVLVFWVKINK